MAINISNHKQEKNHNSSEKLSYEGKKVFVGIDVHKRTYSVVTVVEGMVVKKWRTVASPEKLAQTKRFTIDIKESTHSKLSMLAVKTDRTKAEIVRMLIEEALEDFED